MRGSHPWSTILGEEWSGRPHSSSLADVLASHVFCMQFPISHLAQSQKHPGGCSAFSSCASVERRKDVCLSGIDLSLAFLTFTPRTTGTYANWHIALHNASH